MQIKTPYKILFILIPVAFLFSFLLFLNLVFYFTKLNDTNVEIKTFEYQFNEVNNFRKTSNRGFVTVPNHLEPEEYLSYFNKETGSTNYVTNFFGGTEYRCRGNCYCVENSEQQSRRTSLSNVYSKGLVMFFSAFSVSMAYNLAKETFFDQCDFEDGCSFPSHVEVEIADCTQVSKMSEFQEDKLSKENGNVGEGEEHTTPKPDDNSITYLCKAHCIPLEDPFVPVDKDSYFQGEEFLRIGHQNIGLCEALVVRTKVVVPTTVQFVQISPEQAHELSKVAFIQQFPLHSWCLKQSEMKYEWFSDDGQQAIRGYLQRVADAFNGVDNSLFNDPFFCYGYKLFFDPEKNGWMVNNQDLHNINCVRE